MKRRGFVKALAAVPVAPAVLAQQNTPQNTPPAPAPRTPPEAVEAPKLELATPDDVADMQPRFLTAPQFAALRKLSDMLMPRVGDVPGAIDAGAPEFLDFLISESPNDRQDLYRHGLDALNAEVKKRFDKSFSDVAAEQGITLLEPLRQQWTYDPPAHLLARFLWAAKQDVRTATINSREYTIASASGGGRRGSGVGLYWYPLD
jgi:gluconate 2-dehydrogenase subunit 3-like protein